MNELRERRAALLLESELNRQALRLETLRVQVTLNRLREGVMSGQAVWKWVAPVTAFVLVRKLGGAATLAKSSALVAIGRALWTAWKERRRPAPSTDSGQP